MFPECTVDYWCQDVEYIDYYSTLSGIVDNLSSNFHVVLKEHPSVMGSRPAGFYAQLKNDRRVTVVPTYTSSNEVLGKIDSVLVWTGTVGFEALLRGIAVFGLATPYYASGVRFLNIAEDMEASVLIQHIEYCKRNPITVEEQESLLEALGAQLYKGSFINDGTWSPERAEHLRNSDLMVESFVKGWVRKK
jgi:capsule polysaccharide export protein KpsC/LpsZ